MYVFLGIIFALCILFFIIGFVRRKCIIKKIRHMDCCQKLCLLNDIARPFGFYYMLNKDTMTSYTDAWQKNFGYHSLYDKSAIQFNMVFDYQPIYFDYRDCTWRIEFWKGQYGINIGGEVGIYKADSVLSPEQYDRELFHSVSENEMLHMSMELYQKGKKCLCISGTHWWLTGFRMGHYCEPEDLSMNISITFPCEEMLNCFTDSLHNIGYSNFDYCINILTVQVTFFFPHCFQYRLNHKCRCRISQWQNRILCKLFIVITKPFTSTHDRMLYLYYFLPFCFRHMLRFKRNRKQHRNRRRS